MDISPNDPLPAQKDALVRTIKGVVLAQGNVFIKELLRERGIRIGTTKADFERNMIEAIQSGALQKQHVETWLAEVEGWGNQHVYLFRVPEKICADSLWNKPEAVKSKVAKAGLGAQWNAHSSLEYPPGHTLTGVHFQEGVLRLVWHKGSEFWLRTKAKDYREEIDGDTYEFRAYRLRAERKVTRFELRPRDAMAAIFLQIAVDEDEHKTALENVKKTVGRLWAFDEFSPFAIASTIKKLDARSLVKKDEVVAQSTRLDSSGAYVQFGTTSAQDSYQDFAAVRNVRLAVKSTSFTGMNGTFNISVTDTNGEERRVRALLYASQKRIRLSSQMTSTEVWNFLQLIKENT
jgi:hypothetical protein